MNLVILGAPGAGKGTQAEQLGVRLLLPTISTGMMIRKAIREASEIGLAAKQYIDNGQLLPDDIMIKLINERLSLSDCAKGFILDGYPRTVVQAEELDKSDIRVDRVLSIEVEDEKIVERLSGRLECEKCGASHHVIYRTPKVEGVCDVCGSKLVRRSDDDPEVIRRRLVNYHELTEPLKAYYAKQNKLCVAYGQEEIKDTTREVLKVMGIEEA